jgi:hypothetical protein
MPEVKDSLALPVHYINPHTGREHAAIVIKVREDGAVNLRHYDPESGLGQRRDGVPYSHDLIAGTFHWVEDDNAPKTKEEQAAATLSMVASVQNLTGLPPTASVNVPSGAPANQSQDSVRSVDKGSVELAQSDAPAVQPVAATVPPEAPQPAVDETPQPTPVQEATIQQDEKASQEGQTDTDTPLRAFDVAPHHKKGKK